MKVARKRNHVLHLVPRLLRGQRQYGRIGGNWAQKGPIFLRPTKSYGDCGGPASEPTVRGASKLRFLSSKHDAVGSYPAAPYATHPGISKLFPWKDLRSSLAVGPAIATASGAQLSLHVIRDCAPKTPGKCHTNTTPKPIGAGSSALITLGLGECYLSEPLAWQQLLAKSHPIFERMTEH